MKENNNIFDDDIFDNDSFANAEYEVNDVEPLKIEPSKAETTGVKKGLKEEKNKKETISEEKKTDKNAPNNGGRHLSKDFFRIIGLTIAGIVLALSVWIMVKSFVPEQHEEQFVMSYSYGADATWSVSLLPNDFYEAPSLGMNEIVPVPFVKDVVINFDSYFSTTRAVDLGYTYYVDMDLVTSAADTNKENGGSKLWSKTFRLVQPKTVTESNSSRYNIHESLSIDYSRYNDLVNRYKLTSAIPLTASLNVSLHVDTKGNSAGKEISENTIATVTIPLSVATLSISSNNTATQTKTINNSIIIPSSTNYVLIAISAVLLVGSLIVVIKLLKGLRQMTEEHSLLIKYNKIMHDYNQIIIEIEKLPKVVNAAVIEVKAFKDMLDVQKELHLPIMCEKSKTDDLTDNIFYIINQNQIFRYKLNGDQERF